MNCSKILEMIYDDSENLSVFNHAQIWLHTIICPDCAQEIEKYQVTRDILTEDFFPFTPDLEDSIMSRVETEDLYTETETVPGGFSTKGWVITGLVIFISLATAYFGFDGRSLIAEAGASFLLPMGITIGSVLTVYSVIFIGTHLKELTERFGIG